MKVGKREQSCQLKRKLLHYFQISGSELTTSIIVAGYISKKVKKWVIKIPCEGSYKYFHTMVE